MQRIGGDRVTDVFVRVYATNLIRLGMATSTIDRLTLDTSSTINLHLLLAEGSEYQDWWIREKWFPLERFHIEAKRYAEETAKSDIYVVFDDDQLIIGKDWLERGLEFMDKYKNWGMASAWMITGEVPDRSGGAPGWPERSIGCPYFVRKGILDPMPEGDIKSYDTILTQYVMGKGWVTGFMRHVRYNHLGSQYSQLGLQLGYGWAAGCT